MKPLFIFMVIMIITSVAVIWLGSRDFFRPAQPIDLIFGGLFVGAALVCLYVSKRLSRW